MTADPGPCWSLVRQAASDAWSSPKRSGRGTRLAPWCAIPAGRGGFPPTCSVIVGDVTRPDTLSAAVDGVDAVVFTHGSDGGRQGGAGERRLRRRPQHPAALGSRPARIALMTSIGVTNRTGAYNRSTEAHDWKRRSERLVRASGRPYTIVRPGWFDYNDPDQHRLVLLQGDTRQAGNPSDGAIARSQIAQILVSSLGSETAVGKTFELVAERGPAPDDLEPLFAALEPDPPGALDGVHDTGNMPLEDEPHRVRADLETLAALSGADSKLGESVAMLADQERYRHE